MVNTTLINLTAATADLSVSNFWSAVKPLTLFILGVVIYAVFVFKFYKFIARKDVFKLKTN